MGAAEPVDVFAKTRNRSNWREDNIQLHTEGS